MSRPTEGNIAIFINLQYYEQGVYGNIPVNAELQFFSIVHTQDWNYIHTILENCMLVLHSRRSL